MTLIVWNMCSVFINIPINRHKLFLYECKTWPLNKKAQIEVAKGTVWTEEEQNRTRVDKFCSERIYDFFLHLICY